MKQKISVVRLLFAALSLLAIGYGLFGLWSVNREYEKETKMRERMAEYAPTPPVQKLTFYQEDPVFVNQSIVDAREVNPDIVGWIVLDNTMIDYPFVQAADNDYYLRRNITGEKATAGTVFMDYRCAKDFSDTVTVLYGHNMKNGSMFGALRQYDNPEFFEANSTGWLYLENATYSLQVVASMTVRDDNQQLYAIGELDELDRRIFLENLEENAKRFRQWPQSNEDRFVVLSTCTSASEEMRRVVVAKMTPVVETKEKP